MGLIESLVLSVCISHSPNVHQACVNGLRAGFKQSGYEAKTEQYEHQKASVIQKDAEEYLGKNTADTIGGVAWVGNAAASRSIDISLPTMGIADKVSLEAGESRSLVMFRWSF